jgi:hypothetical protein
MKGCNHAGCPLKHSSHGYCSAHAAQWKRHDRTWDIGQRESIEARIERKSTMQGACRVWQGIVMKNGYGVVSWQGKPWLVHRAVWTEQRGPIPPDMEIDHVKKRGCHSRACTNVEHLEVVTQAENNRRAGGLEVTWANRRTKTHCKHGHEFTPENTYVQRTGGRSCRMCSRRYGLAWIARSGRRKPRELKPCGTVAAYERHRQRGERCDECRAAKAAAARARRSHRVVETVAIAEVSS